MTDLLMFAVLFATYAVFRNNTFGGPGEQELFSLPFVLTETLILLTSSFTAGLTMLALHRENKNQVTVWLIITFLLGGAFLYMEVSEFNKLIAEGHTWQTSAFLSSFFTLIGTHGLHIAVGMFWITTLLIKMWSQGMTTSTVRQITLLNLFWHFLDIVWIFIFSIVYLMGASL